MKLGVTWAVAMVTAAILNLKIPHLVRLQQDISKTINARDMEQKAN